MGCYLAEVRTEPQEERLLAMILALGDKPLRAISIKSSQKNTPAELRIRPPKQEDVKARLAKGPHMMLITSQNLHNH